MSAATWECSFLYRWVCCRRCHCHSRRKVAHSGLLDGEWKLYCHDCRIPHSLVLCDHFYWFAVHRQSEGRLITFLGEGEGIRRNRLVNFVRRAGDCFIEFVLARTVQHHPLSFQLVMRMEPLAQKGAQPERLFLLWYGSCENFSKGFVPHFPGRTVRQRLIAPNFTDVALRGRR